MADGLVLLPGLTRPEADEACRWLGAMAGDDRPLALAEVALPVVLTLRHIYGITAANLLPSLNACFQCASKCWITSARTC